MVNARSLNNRFTLRRRQAAARGFVRLGHYVPTAHCTHIASPRNATHCSIGGWQRRKPRTLDDMVNFL